MDALQGYWHYADMSSYPNYVAYQISFSGEKAIYMAMTAEKEYLAKEISTYTISNGKIKCDWGNISYEYDNSSKKITSLTYDGKTFK